MVPSVPASSNSGPGGGGGNDHDDDDDRDDNRDDQDDRSVGQSTTQDPSTITTAIIIPVDAESHSAANPYSPNPATVSSGATITWTNVDDDRHSATADNGSFSTGILEPGESGEGVIDAEPGAIISYHCDVHPEMRGILYVSDVIVPSRSIGFAGSLLQISDQPLAVGHYTSISEDVENNMTQLSIAGNTTITLPNSTETITTNDTGNITITFTESGMGILEAQIYMTTGDGLENATITVVEFISGENAPGRGVASFSTASTGRLAPLDGIVAIVLDEDQPDGSGRVSFFEWNVGSMIGSNGVETPVNSSGIDISGNQATAAIPPVGANKDGVGSNAIEVSITSGSSSKTTDAYDPNPVEAGVGDTVRWTNDDTTPHTITSGANAQPDGKFDSSPNLNPLLAPGETFEHTFEEAGEYPYYCTLHPNMVGTVSIS